MDALGLSNCVVTDEHGMFSCLYERDGLVQRIRNTQDRRQINIFLTEKGRALWYIRECFRLYRQ